MANRRMFSKSITSSSQFLMMPSSSQNLYFHIGMNADDDGFCEHFAVMRMTDSKPDDLKILQAKGFVNVFDDRVLIIIDWKENNYLRPDRYTPSKYLDVYKKELKRLSSGIPNVDLGKDSIEIVEDTNTETSSVEISNLIKSFEVINQASKKFYSNKTQRDACNSLIESYGYEKVMSIIEKTIPRTNTMEFFPSITTPLQLFEKWATLESAVAKFRSKNNTEVKKNNFIG